jgi:hypothetical protein
VAVGNLETDAWVAYYRRDWGAFLKASVGMVGAGFGMGRRKTLYGAYLVLRANQKWAPYPDNDPDAARDLMRRFYLLVARDSPDVRIDPATAARLEVEWWRLHRAHQHDPGVPGSDLEQSLVDLYAYVYGAEAESVRPAAAARVEAMDLSDAWVDAGCDLDDPLLARERAALVASYTALRAAVGR